MDDPIEQLTRAHPPEFQAIAHALRATVKDAMPGAYETIYHGALSYSLSASAYERLVYVALENGYVRPGI